MLDWNRAAGVFAYVFNMIQGQTHDHRLVEVKRRVPSSTQPTSDRQVNTGTIVYCDQEGLTKG